MTPVFPTLPGITWGAVKTPIWRTVIHSAVSGRELRTAYMTYPLWKFSISIEVLRADSILLEYQTLLGFFNSLYGSYGEFLYTDATDNSVLNSAFGVGDGVTTSFQLTRSIGGFAEPVQNLNGPPVIYINNVTQNQAGVLTGFLGSEPLLVIDNTNQFSVNSTGLVTFAQAPSLGSSLSWSGNFYYRCRFMQDEANFTNIFNGLWELKQLDFQSVKL